MKKLNLIFALLAIVLLNACSSSTSITQRRYNKGFNFEFTRISKGPEYDKQQKIAVSKDVTRKVEAINHEPLQEEVSEVYTSKDVDLENTSASIIPAIRIPSAKVSTIFLANPSEITNVNTSSLSEKEVKNVVQKNKKILKSAIKSKSNNMIDDTLLYVLLILFIPFGTVISMYLYEGNSWTQRVTWNLILTLLCGMPGIIHALVVILGGK
jgi:uncharacterized membrane protein YqaE (UPF0057 family)